ncbi:MAG: hypothetical protein K5931_10690 [Lachnospiraceae bacterium]|nr:hypothetical protein [Lachnospiraceae bacterium]
MSDMILCRGALARNPYFMVSFGINIYSVEELCYLLMTNACLVDEDILDEELCEFLIKEANMAELGHNLRAMLRSKCSVEDFVMEILFSCDYASGEELEAVKTTLIENSGMDKFWKHKVRGDKMLDSGRYNHALDEYRFILESVDEEYDIKLYSSVLHNMGTTYVRLFLMDRAADCYNRAYRMGRQRESLISYLVLMRLLMNRERYGRFVLRQGFEEDVLFEVEDRVKRYKIPDESGEHYKEVKELRKAKESGKVSEYYNKLLYCLDEWKDQYRRSMSNTRN